MNIKIANSKSSEMCKKQFCKLENINVTYQNFVKKLAKYHFEVKAVMQDILECKESMKTLNELNEKGRAKLALLREELDCLELYTREIDESKYYAELEAQKHLLAGLSKEFKEVNMSAMFAVEIAQRNELLNSSTKEDESGVKKRKNVDRDGILKKSTGITDQLLNISRQLADTTQRSQATLDSLVSSSSTVHGTQTELLNTAGSISQSSKLLKKYGRREFTDKVIMFFAFLFFLAVCLYIVQKRLF